jgi:hypothetical protein
MLELLVVKGLLLAEAVVQDGFGLIQKQQLLQALVVQAVIMLEVLLETQSLGMLAVAAVALDI